jgi:hypothetical protein
MQQFNKVIAASNKYLSMLVVFSKANEFAKFLNT